MAFQLGLFAETNCQSVVIVSSPYVPLHAVVAPHSCQLTEKVTAYPLQNPVIGRGFPAPHPTALLQVP